MTEFMTQRKVGEKVLVEGIIEEVRETKKGLQYQIEFKTPAGLHSWITVGEEQLKEVIGYDYTSN